MRRRVVITDVTDMGIGLACVAGIDSRTRQVMRFETPRPQQALLDRIGGLIPGSVVEVEWTAVRAPRAPHVEDGNWVPETLVKHSQLNEEDFVGFLSADAFDSVAEAFGEPVIRGAGGNVAYRPGEGSRSLATIRARTTQLVVWPNKVRVKLVDRSGGQWSGAPLQDLAVKRHRSSCPTCRGRLEEMLRREFEGSDGLVRVGLAREWNGGCWLQVNAVCIGRRQHFGPGTR